VQVAQSTKYLGLYLTENLSWQVHGEFVVAKLHSAVIMIKSLIQCIDRKYLLRFYYTYAYLFMNIRCCILGDLWGCAPKCFCGAEASCASISWRAVLACEGATLCFSPIVPADALATFCSNIVSLLGNLHNTLKDSGSSS
jgi:hypothetical protein